MPSLWTPESWPERLAELEAHSGDAKQAPLRRDIRSLGALLGQVLREQAGDELFEKVETLRRASIARREAELAGDLEAEAARLEEARALTRAAAEDPSTPPRPPTADAAVAPACSSIATQSSAAACAAPCAASAKRATRATPHSNSSRASASSPSSPRIPPRSRAAA